MSSIAQRIKGQEVSILIIRDGVLEDTLVDIQNFNLELQSETKVQGYLGEKHNRVDDVFNQAKFDLELNIHSQSIIPFMQAILDRQQRITPDVVFNISGVFSFPNGETPTLLLPDVKFNSTPINIASRGDYVKVKLDGLAESVTFQTS